MEFINLKQQYSLYREEILEAIEGVLNSGQYIFGEKVQEVEEKLADFCGAKHCITASSGTDTLLIALMSLEIGPGDEVITSPFTFIAPAEMIALLGATPIFVDIDPQTYNIDPRKIEEKITSKTKAILPVSLFGQMADMQLINEIANKHGLYVIEDTAQSFGASLNGAKSGASSLISSTSFYPAKPLGAYGDGGALFTNDDALAQCMREIRNHGGVERYQHKRLGINGRFDTVQAAIIDVKLKHYPDEIKRRISVAETYQKLLTPLCQPGKMTLSQTIEGARPIYSQFSIQHKQRDHLAEWLHSFQIPTCIHYPLGLYDQPAFKYLGYDASAFPETEKVCQEILQLPIHPWLLESDQRMIAEKIEEFLYQTTKRPICR